jgi:hypothetical protein
MAARSRTRRPAPARRKKRSTGSKGDGDVRHIIRQALAEIAGAVAKDGSLFPNGIQSIRLRIESGGIAEIEIDGAPTGVMAAADSAPAEEDFHEDPDLVEKHEGAPAKAFRAEAAAAPEPSGAAWVTRFPGSRSTADLGVDFKPSVEAFLAALAAAGATVRIAATYRPPERAYLMHHAWNIAKLGMSPQSVPPMLGVNIQWAHKDASGRVDLAASRRGAREMVEKYGMAHRAALRSRHTERRAIDMGITWTGTLNVKTANGQTVAVGTPRNGNDNRDLHAIGRSYGVIKLVTDPPHWSEDGH